jgi:uncharacterized Fe-S radical SAM superfamily protein PflX
MLMMLCSSFSNSNTRGVTKANPNGCDPAPSIVCIVDEDEEEEEEVPLVWKNSRCYRVSGGIAIFLLQLCLLLSACKN